VLVVDAGEPRNAPAGHVHNYLGREGSTPADLLADGRAAVTGYGGRVVPGTVVAVDRVAGEEPAFRIALADGHQVAARRLLVATGLVDELPDVPGVAERWGIDVLHCPYCHGWEARNQAIGILGDGPMAVHQALMWRQLSEDVTLFLHRAPKPSDDEREQLAARGIAVVEGEVAGLELVDDRLTGVRLGSGEVVAVDALGVQPVFAARSELLDQLGITPAEMVVADRVIARHVVVDRAGATGVPGVYAAGNVADPMAQVMSAAAAGLMAGAAINGDLVTEETAAAVAAHRDRLGATV
jgi:thioredoxin reductase